MLNKSKLRKGSAHLRKIPAHAWEGMLEARVRSASVKIDRGGAVSLRAAGEVLGVVKKDGKHWLPGYCKTRRDAVRLLLVWHFNCKR